ncbi:DsrE family protein [Natronococcus jeotgali]|uniref:Uncharacterized protein n=1 Tax=Natronococcus jeotgali DSM 18795 TaxID=1227498 RepID=L9XWT7_9EURY|nr:DsrE family protein [Natronococcus jeotgali]ELY66235.1 hypothetical protein C492_01603 [Natronococcus jeotgali DSM 18795]
MDRRKYLAGAGSIFGVGAVGGYAAGRSSEDEAEPEGTDEKGSEQTEGEGQEPPIRTLLHLSSADPSDHGTALNNAENLVDDSTVDNDVVRLVANSRGIFVLVDGESEHADRVRSLSESGIEFAACENSMDGLGVSESDLLSGVDTVPSAVGELAKRQAEGYGYIKVP